MYQPNQEHKVQKCSLLCNSQIKVTVGINCFIMNHYQHVLVEQWRLYGAVWICCFPSLITLFPSPITQNWWVPWLFGFVFSFCFHHSILWFLSDELWKLKTHFRCFQVIKTELLGHCCKFLDLCGTSQSTSATPNVSLPFLPSHLYLYSTFWTHSSSRNPTGDRKSVV